MNDNLRPGDLPASDDERFVQLLTSIQLKLLHYIAMLLGDPNEAANVLQETNLVMWRKSSEFQLGTNFSAWAHQVAYWQVQAYVRDRRRDRHVFDESLIGQLASHEPEVTVEPEVRVALRHCLSQVSPRNLDMLRKRYEGGQSIATLAETLGKSPSAVKVGLMRIRKSLLQCIQHKLAK
jgi:RNA polymerase sigma-70 factor, ECF subfamily